MTDRPVDHLVLAGRDLDALAGTYRRLGFLVGGRNQHPWGTENRIIQLEGSFLELLSLGASFEILDADNPAAPFANSLSGYLKQREGLAMVALQSSDAQEDARHFAASHVAMGEPLHFSRTSETPDGKRRDVAFTTAFALEPGETRPEFFVCQHHRPENFWNGAMQTHPNGARRLLGLVLTAQNPSGRTSFLTTLFGPDATRVAEADVVVRAGPQRIDIVPPRQFQAAYGDGGDDRPAAVRIGVETLDSVTRFLNVMGSPYTLRDSRLIVPPSVGRGVTLSFEPFA